MESGITDNAFSNIKGIHTLNDGMLLRNQLQIKHLFI